MMTAMKITLFVRKIKSNFKNYVWFILLLTAFNSCRFSNMSVVHVDSCLQYFGIPSPSISSYADGWIVQQPIDRNCTFGSIRVDNCTTENVENSQTQCAPISHAASGIGTFGNCRPMGATLIGESYRECVFEDCRQNKI